MTRRGLIVSASFLPVLARAGAEYSTLTISDYWLLNKASLEVSAAEWRARIDAMARTYGERKRLLAISAQITRDFAEQYKQVHARFGTSPQAYLRYGSEHSREIENYFTAQENLSLRHDIEQLRETIKVLMQRFDGLAEPVLRERK